MANFAEIVSAVRALLDDPYPQAPNPRVVLEHFKQNAQLLLTQAQNAAISWSVNSWILTTSPDQGEYLVTAENFGKDVLCHSLAPAGDNWFPERTIPRLSLQSREQGYYGPKDATIAGTYPSAELMVFYRENESVYVQVRPVPMGECQYKIWYDTAPLEQITPGMSPILPISHPYLQLRVAANCLPYCKWEKLSLKECAEKKAEIGKSLLGSIPEQRDAFLKYIATDRQMGVTVRRGFDDESYDGGWGYGIF